MNIPDPRFIITDKVYHITPDSPQGVVVDARWLLLDKRWEYLVAFSINETRSYYDYELSKHKTFT